MSSSCDKMDVKSLIENSPSNGEDTLPIAGPSDKDLGSKIQDDLPMQGLVAKDPTIREETPLPQPSTEIKDESPTAKDETAFVLSPQNKDSDQKNDETPMQTAGPSTQDAGLTNTDETPKEIRGSSAKDTVPTAQNETPKVRRRRRKRKASNLTRRKRRKQRKRREEEEISPEDAAANGDDDPPEKLPQDYRTPTDVRNGDEIAVYWEGSKTFYTATAQNLRPDGKRRIEYDDGEVRYHEMKKELFVLCGKALERFLATNFPDAETENDGRPILYPRLLQYVEVGSLVNIYWPSLDTFRPGTVCSNNGHGRYHVTYEDGDTEVVNLEERAFRFRNLSAALVHSRLLPF